MSLPRCWHHSMEPACFHQKPRVKKLQCQVCSAPNPPPAPGSCSWQLLRALHATVGYFQEEKQKIRQIKAMLWKEREKKGFEAYQISCHRTNICPHQSQRGWASITLFLWTKVAIINAAIKTKIKTNYRDKWLYSISRDSTMSELRLSLLDC